jgi:oligogalacturonide lyase
MRLTTLLPTARRRSFTLFLLAALGASRLAAQTNLPAEWVDADTGHRVARLSREPGSTSLYFNLNGFTRDGRRLVFTAPSGIDTVDLQSRAIEQLVPGHARLLMVGRKTGRVYFLKGAGVFTVDPDTKAVSEVAKAPTNGSVITVNADETLLAGTITEPDTNAAPAADAVPRTKAKNIQVRFDKHLTMELFVVDIATGDVKIFDRGTDWLNHLQFSPTDPTLLLFCHEGPWQYVDRIWTIRTDGSDLKLIHQRTMAMEIAGHEFWGADGSNIWYDLQTPRGEDFWVAGYNVATGARTRYHLQRDEWSVHYNVSPDGKLFSGDGGSPGMAGRSKNGQWLHLFHPEPVTGHVESSPANLIMPGVFRSEKLVNMARHDYSLEPNATFTPDGKWLVFRSNMEGAAQVYAVELKKADAK